MSDKIKILRIFLENKNILFGKNSPYLTKEIRINKWKEITEKVRQIYAKTGLNFTKDWTYLRNTIWQNWRKRTIGKVDIWKSDVSLGRKRRKIDEGDLIILNILGRDLTEIEALPICEPSVDPFVVDKEDINEEDKNEEDTNEEDTNEEDISEEYINEEFISSEDIKEEQPTLKITKIETLKNETYYENKILKMKLKLLKRECYLKDLEIFKKEEELDLTPSSFTQPFCERQKLSPQEDNISVSEANGQSSLTVDYERGLEESQENNPTPEWDSGHNKPIHYKHNSRKRKLDVPESNPDRTFCGNIFSLMCSLREDQKLKFRSEILNTMKRISQQNITKKNLIEKEEYI